MVTNAAAPVVHLPSVVTDVLILAVVARSRVADEAKTPLWGIK